MNNTERAIHEMAEKMIKGHIEVTEIALMTGLSEDELNKTKENIALSDPTITHLDTMDIDLGSVLFDNNDIDEALDDEY